MILTEIGEVGLEFEGRSHVLRPSLYAMTRIGSPAEIVRVFASVCADFEHPTKHEDALATITACCEDDLTALYGHYEMQDVSPFDFGKRCSVFVPAVANEAETIALAQRLLIHGVTGALPAPQERGAPKGEYVQEFDARAHVATAIAHLGIPSRDAWQMTMTELVGALRSKFPPVESNEPGSKAPSDKKLQETMDWHDKVLAMKG